MGTVLIFGVAVLVWQVQSQCIPRLPLPTPQPQIATPVVAATIIDNSVSNALANAIQLLIVSNLIENTMNKNIPCYDSVPICPNINIPDIITPCDVLIPSCDPIKNIPNVCLPDIVPIIPNFACDCGNNYPVPNYDCGNFYPAPNMGCECANCYPNALPVTNIGCDCPNYYPVSIPNYGCDCGNCYPMNNFDCGNTYPVPSCDCNYYPVPNFGCDQPNMRPSFGPMFPCNSVAPVTAELVFPTTIPAQLNCNFGGNNIVPNLPCAVKVDPWANYFDIGCGGKPFGNGYYR